MEIQKVGIYARVSTEEEKQQKAFERQVEELTNFVNSKPEWQLVEIYADKGLSGTETTRRKGYKKMIKDIEAGNLDIIVIKNESRLNRNTLEGLKFLKLITENNVKLYFYMEQKYYDPYKDLDVKIKMIIAEESSKELSKNINTAQRKRQLKGRVITNNRMWGYIQKDGQLIIREDEAKIVKKIFEMYAEGKGFRTIQQDLKNLIPTEIKERRGIDTLPLTTLKRMIKNEKYKGTVIGNKRHKDFFTKKIKNNPPEEWIIVENACPAIVSKELWEKANQQLQKKRKEFNLEEKRKIAGYFQGTYFLSNKIYCAKCGKVFWHSKNYSARKKSAWQCSTYKEFGKSACPAPTIYTNNIKFLLQNVIFQFAKNKDKAINNVIKILKKALDEPEKNNEEISILEKQLNKLRKRKENLENDYLDRLFTKEEFVEKKSRILAEITQIEKQIQELRSKNAVVLGKIERLNMIKKALENEFEAPENITEEIIQEMIEKVIVHEKDKFDIIIQGDILLENVDSNNFEKFSSVSDSV